MFSTMPETVFFIFIVLTIYDLIRWVVKRERITYNDFALNAVASTIGGFVACIVGSFIPK